MYGNMNEVWGTIHLVVQGHPSGKFLLLATLEINRAKKGDAMDI